MPSTILTSYSGTPIHRRVAITISLGTVSNVFSSRRAPKPFCPVPPVSSLPYVSGRTVPLLFLNPCCYSTKSPSALLLILSSRTLSNSFSAWLSELPSRIRFNLVALIGYSLSGYNAPSCRNPFRHVSVPFLSHLAGIHVPSHDALPSHHWSSSGRFPSIFISATVLIMSVSSLFVTCQNHSNRLLLIAIRPSLSPPISSGCYSVTSIGNRTILIFVVDIPFSSLAANDHVSQSQSRTDRTTVF